MGGAGLLTVEAPSNADGLGINGALGLVQPADEDEGPVLFQGPVSPPRHRLLHWVSLRRACSPEAGGPLSD